MRELRGRCAHRRQRLIAAQGGFRFDRFGDIDKGENPSVLPSISTARNTRHR
jgi:hypothetical protein